MHIDIHPIPANDSKGEPEHQHIDFRFVFRAAVTTDVCQLQTEEVTDAAWRDAEGIGDPALRQRLAALQR